MLTFIINGAELKIENALYIDARFVIAEHPETGKPCLFMRGDTIRPYKALDELGLKLSGISKWYNDIEYRELEDEHGESETGDNSKDDLLLGGAGQQKVEDDVHRELVPEGASEVTDEVPEGVEEV